MKHFKHFLLLTIMISCSSEKKKKWFSCSTVLSDTVKIEKDWSRGSYLVQDSLVLSAGLYPFDTAFCNTIKLRTEPIISYQGKHICSIGDLYPPFYICKPNVSDTLIVIKDGKVIYFKIPYSHCGDTSEW